MIRWKIGIPWYSTKQNVYNDTCASLKGYQINGIKYQLLHNSVSANGSKRFSWRSWLGLSCQRTSRTFLVAYRS